MMGRFLRIVLLIILAAIGFGTGICGLFGLGVTTFDTLKGSADSFAGIAAALSAVALLIAVGCWFGIRALMRSLRARAPVDAPPPVEPPSPGTGP